MTLLMFLIMFIIYFIIYQHLTLCSKDLGERKGEDHYADISLFYINKYSDKIHLYFIQKREAIIIDDLFEPLVPLV